MKTAGNSPARMPVLFLGHGDPQNAIRDNDFTRALAALGASLPSRPEAVLVVSAHWLTERDFVCSSAAPETIHDFYGFPDELYRARYPAPGAPALARRVAELLPDAATTDRWGLDHGAWSVLTHLLPAADVPCLQLSIRPSASYRRCREIGAALAPLRDDGVLILGSGNIVHNLGMLGWNAPGFDWCRRFDAWVKERLDAGPRATAAAELEDPAGVGGDGRLAVPTMDHYAPLLYALGAAEGEGNPSYPYEGLEHGSLSMRCVRWG